MFVCEACGAKFDAPSYHQEIDGFDENDREVYMQTFSCPLCAAENPVWREDDDRLGGELWNFLERLEDERREREELLNEN